MRKIAVINQIGGVGKTTITTNLGHALALKGYSVMVIDLDPQGQLAASFGIFRPPSKGLDQIILNGSGFESVHMKVRDLITMIPAGIRLHEVEELNTGGASRAKLLKSAIRDELNNQDFILYDCPPSAGVLVANAIFAADEVVMPVGGDYLSLNGLAKMITTLKRFEPYLEKPLIKWISLSRYLPRRRLSSEVLVSLLKHFPDQVFSTSIRETAVMAECPGAGRTIFEYRQSSRSAREFEALGDDLIEKRTMRCQME